MNKTEIVNLVQLVTLYFPSWKINDLELTIEAWHVILKDYEAEIILKNLKAYVKTGGRFAPSVGQLIPQSGRSIPNQAETKQMLLAMHEPKQLPTKDELKKIFSKMDKMLGVERG